MCGYGYGYGYGFSAPAPVDFQPPGVNLSSCALVIAPLMHVAACAALQELDGYERGGGHLVRGYQSMIQDRNLHVWPDGTSDRCAAPLACGSKNGHLWPHRPELRNNPRSIWPAPSRVRHRSGRTC